MQPASSRSTALAVPSARSRLPVPGRVPRRRDDGGQTTAEYALVLLAAAAVALLVVAWATRSGKVGQLFNAVMDSIISKV